MSDGHIPRTIACNYFTPTGAKGFVCSVDTGSGGERVEVLQRNRDGRWVRKWFKTARLCNFRVVAVPDSLLTDERLLTSRVRDLGELAGMLERHQSTEIHVSPSSELA